MPILFILAIATCVETQGAMPAEARPLPTVVMYPPSHAHGQCFRELFEQPDAWKGTRGAVGALGYADHVLNRQFSDQELGAWLPRLREWGLRLELEVGAVKEWGPPGAATFAAESPLWDRFQRLGGSVFSVAMDEPLCCTRQTLKLPDDYAVRETVDFVARVRERYPDVLVGDIEPCPYIPVDDLMHWTEAVQRQLAARGTRGLDFLRLDVDWLHFVRGNGAWPDIKRLEDYCRSQGLAFSLIYWAADYPALAQRGLADDATWYVSVLRQGYDYANVGGRPDQFVIESWIGAPSHSVPETDPFTFTRSVLDFAHRFTR